MTLDGAIILVLLLSLPALSIVGLVDAARRPAEHWQFTGRSKGTWLVCLILFGVVGSAFYWVMVRPKLLDAERSGVPTRPRVQATSKAPRRREDWGDPWQDD